MKKYYPYNNRIIKEANFTYLVLGKAYEGKKEKQLKRMGKSKFKLYNR